MFTSIQCSSCQETFDVDTDMAAEPVECPHCHAENVVEAPAPKPELTILHDAPTLAGAKPCPKCKAVVEPDAVICIHCGYNFMTGKKIGGESWFAKNKTLAILLIVGGVLVLGAAVYSLWPGPAPQPIRPPVEEPAAPVVAPAPVAEPEPEPVVEEEVVEPEPEPVVEEEAPPPGPTPEELAMQKAAEERAAFEARKKEAEQVLRQRLDAREPMYKLGDKIEVRLKNGVVHKGELRRFAGTGAERAAILKTEFENNLEIPLQNLDVASRRRLDADFREAFINHMLSQRMPEPSE